jgi:hypothetical protein
MAAAAEASPLRDRCAVIVRVAVRGTPASASLHCATLAKLRCHVEAAMQTCHTGSAHRVCAVRQRMATQPADPSDVHGGKKKIALHWRIVCARRVLRLLVLTAV